MRNCFNTLSALFALAAIPALQGEKRTTDRLLDEAQAVVVAEVQSGQQVGYSAAFTLSVVRTLKGSFGPGDTINVAWGSTLTANKSLKGDYGLWFLSQAAVGGPWTLKGVLQGQYPFEFAYFPLPKASSLASLNTVARPKTVNDQAASELAAALEAYTDPSQIYHLALGFLSIGESDAAPVIYGALRAHPDPEIRFIGLAGLIRSNDPTALGEVASNIEQVPNLQARGLLASAISGRRDTDPVAISQIGRIASSSSVVFQGAGAEALKNIHTRDTLPYLADLLDSGDARIREAAMIGLSRFVDNLPVQTQFNVLNFAALTPQGPAPYRTALTDTYSLSRRWLGAEDETKYIQFWKSWWAHMKDELTVKAP